MEEFGARIDGVVDFCLCADCDGMDCPEVWARIAVLNGQTQAAELLYLEQNQVDKAVQMYLSLHQWENGKYEKLCAKTTLIFQHLYDTDVTENGLTDIFQI